MPNPRYWLQIQYRIDLRRTVLQALILQALQVQYCNDLGNSNNNYTIKHSCLYTKRICLKTRHKDAIRKTVYNSSNTIFDLRQGQVSPIQSSIYDSVNAGVYNLRYSQAPPVSDTVKCLRYGQVSPIRSPIYDIVSTLVFPIASTISPPYCLISTYQQYLRIA